MLDCGIDSESIPNLRTTHRRSESYLTESEENFNLCLHNVKFQASYSCQEARDSFFKHPHDALHKIKTDVGGRRHRTFADEIVMMSLAQDR